MGRTDLDTIVRTRLALLCLLGGFMTSLSALLVPSDPAQVRCDRQEAREAFAKGDKGRLLTMLEVASPEARPNVALYLGRLGVREALQKLKGLSEACSQPAGCSPAVGEYGVAVILIENEDRAAQKGALLEVAAATYRDGYAMSVIDMAGAELARYGGDDVVRALSPIRTYGAQYAVLAIQCARLSREGAITRCIEVLSVHENPQCEQAAVRLLTETGNGDTAGRNQVGSRLLQEFSRTQDSRLKVSIMRIWGAIEYRDCLGPLLDLLQKHHTYWAGQGPALGAWTSEGRLGYPPLLREMAWELKEVLCALGRLGDQRAREAIELTRRQWQTWGDRWVLCSCDQALRALSQPEQE